MQSETDPPIQSEHIPVLGEQYDHEDDSGKVL